MKITENAPAERTFTIEVNKSELQLIEFALLQDRSDREADAAVTNYDVWSRFSDFIEHNDITRLDEDAPDDDELPF